MVFSTRPGALTENGWPQIQSKNTVLIQPLPHLPVIPVADYPVSVIFADFIIEYDKTVEPIKTQIWGWSGTNSVENSNHLSGTAIDINAPIHPFGAPPTPASWTRRVRDLLSKYSGVIYWGGDWNYPDPMHFQIGIQKNSALLYQVVAEIQKGSTLSTSEVEKLKAFITQGNNRVIREVQDYLSAISIDVKDIRQQLTGGRDAGQYPGWPQLGNKTVTDAVAEVLKKLEK